ncbi:MAG TPA: type ISP restriction/modification enzyme, partial [Sandaracinaceae bacterium]
MREPSALERAAARAAEEREAAVGAEERKEHGVVHTPPELAAFTARAADHALRRLGRAGLADPRVAIVDPACGPGAFLAAALALGGASAPRAMVGIDLDARAVATARALLEPEARRAGWPLRLEVADTLERSEVLTEAERRGATIAILGNPPWAGKAARRGGARMDSLLEDFRRDARGEPLRERKIGVLSDAYVRFFRWACELARRAEGGAVVALVTNASFLDGPVHRGMRAALSRWFSSIDVLDLGGSALVARRAGRDENVFGVRPSVALTVAVREPAAEGRARVRVARLRGTREDKLERVGAAGSIEDFGPRPVDGGAWTVVPAIDPRYARWPSIAALMPFHREGLQTNRDAFCVDVDRDALLARLRAFAEGAPGPWPGHVDRASAHYDPERARAAVRSVLARDPEAREHVVRVAYRPGEFRWMAVIPRLCHRPRPDLLSAMRRSEAALLTVRKDRGERPWAHFGIVREPPDNCFSSTRSSCRTRAFPTHDPSGRPNVDGVAAAAFAERLRRLPNPLE